MTRPTKKQLDEVSQVTDEEIRRVLDKNGAAMNRNGSTTKRLRSPNNDPTLPEICKPTPEHPVVALSSSWCMSVMVALLALALGVLTPVLLSRNLLNQAGQLAWPEQLSRHDRTLVKNGTPLQRQKQSEERVDSIKSLPRYPCTESLLDQFWHDQPVKGFHILCLNSNMNNNHQLEMTLYKNGMRRSEKTIVMENSPVRWERWKAKVEQSLVLTPSDTMHQPWAFFTPAGERVLDERTTEDEVGWLAHKLATEVGTLLVYQGGQFVWPGVRIGFSRTVSIYDIMPPGSPSYNTHQNVTLETLSLVPLVLSVKGFLSQEECQYIQEKAKPTMEYSSVVLMDRDAGRPASDFRTSQTSFLSSKNDDILTDLDYRTASLSRLPRNHQEPVQILRYGIDEKYTSHHDFFDPRLYQQDKGTLRLIANGRRNRFLTVFWYLSDVPAGGETTFPRFNGGREVSSADCTTGLQVKPEKGKVILFYSMTADGQVDHHSLHGACPVREGVKWAANKWIWNEAMGYVPP